MFHPQINQTVDLMMGNEPAETFTIFLHAKSILQSARGPTITTEVAKHHVNYYFKIISSQKVLYAPSLLIES